MANKCRILRINIQQCPSLLECRKGFGDCVPCVSFYTEPTMPFNVEVALTIIKIELTSKHIGSLYASCHFLHITLKEILFHIFIGEIIKLRLRKDNLPFTDTMGSQWFKLQAMDHLAVSSFKILGAFHSRKNLPTPAEGFLPTLHPPLGPHTDHTQETQCWSP